MNKLSHIAIIMDGNGRWAKSKNKSRLKGHQEGASIVQDITQEAKEQGVKFLTLYAFSTENWKRPKSEVNALMSLFEKYLNKEGSFYIKNNVRFNVIGDTSRLSLSIQNNIKYIMEQTRHHDSLTQTLAVNYGSRDEIIRAIKKANANNEEINELTINKYLDTNNLPDVDLLIRTGGDMRVSNYLLWQIAYAELSFTHTLWPDFNPEEFRSIIDKFYTTKRNFGGI